MATVSDLMLYPVKGCAGSPLTRARVLPTGVLHDRSFMFVRESDGVFRSQRTTPGMSVVYPELSTDADKLTLSAPDTTALVLDVRQEGPRREVEIHRIWRGEAVDQGDEAADWASTLLGEPVRLVRVAPDHERAVDEWHGVVTFTDSTPLHLTSVSSLDDLNARIRRKGADPVPMARFRSNIVIEGWDTPYTEDSLRDFVIGTARLRWVKPDIRCKVTMVDQLTGHSAGPEPLRTLADYRREPEGGVSFGIKVAVTAPGEIQVGDELVVG
ncbi:MOSC domain-containing protein [Actinophytocola oryzae]|uniref:MOSC domain-containing protein n=1 Tax=Actinophytocola oryzae TaxID=502181 RepID=UPI001063AFF6|nr:MOSC N-terminal beta barrel domain-containing protein [Actinophytocola oryzae]